ncbi:hypothetical protein [Nocardioides terrigena]|uniref:hypothetical protein n=1 Tax=Nocardioides terrigena TaxID=424797 RepID=UPI00131F105E|nr:hypothetical protein [Nocardioides terrigena]
MLPTKPVFDDIAQERHKAAHDAKAAVDIIALSPIPKQLVRLGFAVDALLSVGAARIVQRSASSAKGRQAVTFTRLVRRPGTSETWAQYAGPARAAVQRAVKVHVASLNDVVDGLGQHQKGSGDVVCVLEPDISGKLDLVNWRCLGI